MKNKGFKSFCAGVAILLVMAMFVGLCMQLWAKDEYKPSNWGVPSETQDNGNELNGGLIIPEVSEGSSIKLLSTPIPVELYSEYDIAPVSVQSAYTLTATITPAESNVSDFTWSVKFKNSSSTWARGKSIDSYVGLAVNTSDKLKCTVTCKQAFGEPVEISISYDYNPLITATVQADYIKRVEKVTVSGFDASKFNSGTACKLSLIPTYGVGTVQGDCSITSSWGELDTDYLNAITGNSQAGRFYSECENIADSDGDGLDFWDSSKKVNKTESSSSLALSVNSFLKYNIPSSAMDYLKAAFVQATKEIINSSHLRAAVEYTYSYSTLYSSTGIAYSSYGAIDISKLDNPYTGLENVDIGPDLYF